MLETLTTSRIEAFLKACIDSAAGKTLAFQDDAFDVKLASKDCLSLTAGTYSYKSLTPGDLSHSMFSFDTRSPSNSSFEGSRSGYSEKKLPTSIAAKREVGLRRKMIAECKSLRNQVSHSWLCQCVFTRDSLTRHRSRNSKQNSRK